MNEWSDASVSEGLCICCSGRQRTLARISFRHLYNNIIGNNSNKIGAKSGGRPKGGAKKNFVCPWQKLSRARSDEHMAATGCSLAPCPFVFIRNFLLIRGHIEGLANHFRMSASPF